MAQARFVEASSGLWDLGRFGFRLWGLAFNELKADVVSALVCKGLRLNEFLKPFLSVQGLGIGCLQRFLGLHRYSCYRGVMKLFGVLWLVTGCNQLP